MYSENKSAINSPCVQPFFALGRYIISMEMLSRGITGFKDLVRPIPDDFFTAFLLSAQVIHASHTDFTVRLARG